MPRRNPEDAGERLTHSQKQRKGEESARVARVLMSMKEPDFLRVHMDDILRAHVVRARSIATPAARRREERRLAGILRATGIPEMNDALEGLNQDKRQGARQFQLVEKLRERILADDDSALSSVVADPNVEPWPTLVAEARRERDTGKPRGASKRLFRAIAAATDEAINAAKLAAMPKVAGDDFDDDSEPSDTQ